MAGSMTVWLDQIRQGDKESVAKVWERLFPKICHRVSPMTKRLSICDAEDIASSALQEFCTSLHSRDDHDLGDRKKAWRLLTVIALRKARDWRKYDHADRRGGGKTMFSLSESTVGTQPSSTLPADQALQQQEDRNQLLDQLNDPVLKNVALLRQRGYTNRDIAAQLSCSVRTVQNMISQIKSRWQHSQPDSCALSNSHAGKSHESPNLFQNQLNREHFSNGSQDN